jgi:hypothetical protein
MRIAFVLILASVQATTAQNLLTLRVGTDLAAPASSSNPFIPSYGTWTNHYSVGGDLTVELVGPAFWNASFDYTTRKYSHFQHPFGRTDLKTYGGDGRIIRAAISAGVRTRVSDKGSVSARFGMEFFESRYEPVYYENGIWWDPGPGPTVDRALSPSTRYVAPVGVLGFTYSLLVPFTLAVDLSVHRNRSTGVYFRSTFGVGLAF